MDQLCPNEVFLHSSHPHLGGGGGRCLSHFSEGLYKKDFSQTGILGRNWHFRWGWLFSGVTWKIIRISNQKKMVVISIISQFCFPTLTTSQYSVFVSLFSMVYIPLHSQIFFLGGAKNFFRIKQLGTGKISNFFWTFCIGGT